MCRSVAVTVFVVSVVWRQWLQIMAGWRFGCRREVGEIKHGADMEIGYNLDIQHIPSISLSHSLSHTHEWLKCGDHLSCLHR